MSSLTGVGHEVETLQAVRRSRATSWDIEYPKGVVCSFQVSSNKVEPSDAVLA
jgi:hypothetical protein